MLEANVRILYALKSFLKEVNEKTEYKTLFRISVTDFTRNRKLSFDKLVLLIVRLCKKTLSVELEHFFAEVNGGYPCSVAAFSLQRMKLKPTFYYSWNKCLCSSFYSEYGNKIKRWRGFRVIGCDGSSISLVNKPALAKYFGGQSNQSGSFVVAKTFYGYDVLNKMILFPQIAPYRYGELPMAYDLIENGHIQSDMLLVLDRHYSNYKIASLLSFQEQEIKYVIRAKDSLIFAKQFVASGKKSDVIYLLPGPSAIIGLRKSGYIIQKDTSLKIRLIRVVLPSGKIEILMTNLWEEEGYPSHEFKFLYSLRWNVESNIYFQKNILQLESLSGLSATAIMQDFFATVFITNLHFLLIKQAQHSIHKKAKNKKYPMKVNNNRAFGKIKENLISLFISQRPEVILYNLNQYFIRAPLPVREGRSFPRIRKNPLTKCKHKTFTNYKPAY